MSTGRNEEPAAGSNEQPAPGSSDAAGPAPAEPDARGRRLVELTRSECLTLLASTDFGRVVVSSASTQTPVIRPVSYVFDAPSQSVVFRTAPGSKFHALVHSERAWFEIDAIDPETRCGWSVIVAGVTEQVSRADEIRRLEHHVRRAWAPGNELHWVRIRASTVSGRRIALDGE